MRWTSRVALAGTACALLLAPASAGAEITKLAKVPEKLDPKSSFDYQIKVTELNPDGWEILGGMIKGRDCPVDISSQSARDFWFDKVIEGTEWGVSVDGADEFPAPTTHKESGFGKVKGKDDYFVCVYYTDGDANFDVNPPVIPPTLLSAERKIKVK